MSCRRMLGRGLSSRSGRNLYELLGIEQNATSTEIKTAYFRLSRQLHPDTTKTNDPLQVTRFQAISEAYGTLISSERRAAYDRTLGGTGAVPETYTGPSRVHATEIADEMLRRQTQLNTERVRKRKETRNDVGVVKTVQDMRGSRVYWYLGFVLAACVGYVVYKADEKRSREERIKRTKHLF